MKGEKVSLDDMFPNLLRDERVEERKPLLTRKYVGYELECSECGVYDYARRGDVQRAERAHAARHAPAQTPTSPSR
jgi:hypothetical protein